MAKPCLEAAGACLDYGGGGIALRFEAGEVGGGQIVQQRVGAFSGGTDVYGDTSRKGNLCTLRASKIDERSVAGMMYRVVGPVHLADAGSA